MGSGLLPAVKALPFFLVFLRIAGFLVATPMLRAMQVPPSVRFILLAGFAAAMSSMLPPGASPIGNAQLFVAACREVALGATLGLGVLAAFGAIEFAGRLLDVQLGFGLAQVFDPTTQARSAVLATAFNQVGVLVFLSLDGLHGLLRALSTSLDRFPPGIDWFKGLDAGAVLQQIGSLFVLGFALAGPVVFCVLLVELVLGVMSRNLPQMNMFVIALPAKVLVGCVALALWAPLMGGGLQRIYASIAQGWERAVLPSHAGGSR